MNNMFYYLYYIEELDLSSFDMSNVKSMNYWLAYCYKLKSLKLNNASFGSATQYSLSFYQLPSSIYVVAKDDDSRNWIQTQLGSGKGTIVTVAELG
jgi:surface protein